MPLSDSEAQAILSALAGESNAQAALVESGALSNDQLARLQRSQQALNEGTPPGAEPERPLGRSIMDAAYEAQGGVRSRPAAGMDAKAMNAGFSELWRRAKKGDPQAVYKQPEETWADATERWRRSQE